MCFKCILNIGGTTHLQVYRDLLIFAPHVVQTLPEPATRSDLMPNFVKGYLGKKYGVET